MALAEGMWIAIGAMTTSNFLVSYFIGLSTWLIMSLTNLTLPLDFQLPPITNLRFSTTGSG